MPGSESRSALRPSCRLRVRLKATAESTPSKSATSSANTTLRVSERRRLAPAFSVRRRLLSRDALLSRCVVPERWVHEPRRHAIAPGRTRSQRRDVRRCVGTRAHQGQPAVRVAGAALPRELLGDGHLDLKHQRRDSESRVQVAGEASKGPSAARRAQRPARSGPRGAGRLATARRSDAALQDRKGVWHEASVGPRVWPCVPGQGPGLGLGPRVPAESAQRPVRPRAESGRWDLYCGAAGDRARDGV
jgi:hypothetical protein